MTPVLSCSRSLGVIAYSTSPFHGWIDTGQSALKARISRVANFSITFREAVLSAMVEATS